MGARAALRAVPADVLVEAFRDELDARSPVHRWIRRPFRGLAAALGAVGRKLRASFSPQRPEGLEDTAAAATDAALRDGVRQLLEALAPELSAWRGDEATREALVEALGIPTLAALQAPGPLVEDASLREDRAQLLARCRELVRAHLPGGLEEGAIQALATLVYSVPASAAAVVTVASGGVGHDAVVWVGTLLTTPLMERFVGPARLGRPHRGRRSLVRTHGGSLGRALEARLFGPLLARLDAEVAARGRAAAAFAEGRRGARGRRGMRWFRRAKRGDRPAGHVARAGGAPGSLLDRGIGLPGARRPAGRCWSAWRRTTPARAPSPSGLCASRWWARPGRGKSHAAQRAGWHGARARGPGSPDLVRGRWPTPRPTPTSGTLGEVVPRVVRYMAEGGSAWSGQVFVDTPDLNSVARANADAALAVLDQVDAALLVFHRGSVAEARPTDALRPFARRRALLGVVNFADQLGPEAQETLREQVARVLQAELGLAEPPPVFVVSALRARLGEPLDDDWEVLQAQLRTLAEAGVATELRRRNAEALLGRSARRVADALRTTEEAQGEVRKALDAGLDTVRTPLGEDFRVRLGGAGGFLRQSVRRQAAGRLTGPIGMGTRLSGWGSGRSRRRGAGVAGKPARRAPRRRDRCGAGRGAGARTDRPRPSASCSPRQRRRCSTAWRDRRSRPRGPLAAARGLPAEVSWDYRTTRPGSRASPEHAPSPGAR